VSWRNDAACRDMPAPDALFYPWGAESLVRENRAEAYAPGVAFCAGCPVVVECLRDALRTNDRFGVRGGTTPDQRIGMRA